MASLDVLGDTPTIRTEPALMDREISIAILLALVVSLLCASGCHAYGKSELARGAPFVPSHNGPVCLLAGGLPTGFEIVELGRVIATKGTYGSVDELDRVLATEARKLGTDAVIYLQSSQRFKGPLPWRVAAPTGSGTAVKIKPESPKLDCAQIGGRSA